MVAPRMMISDKEYLWGRLQKREGKGKETCFEIKNTDDDLGPWMWP